MAMAMAMAAALSRQLALSWNQFPPQLSAPLYKPAHSKQKIIFNCKSNPVELLDGLAIQRGTKMLKDLSTWGIGGPCDYFIQVSSQTQLVSAVRFCQETEVPFIIIGNGSNCLFDDLGLRGCVILNRIDFLERMEPGTYVAGSGFRFDRLGLLCATEDFAGLEFAAGIPGTVGGAVYMNAGANGQETADAIDSVDILTSELKHHKLRRDELKFGYRYSAFQDMNNLIAIVGATFRLRRSDSARSQQQEYLKRRRNSQPIGEKSAGSVFRNPCSKGVLAAKLIEDAGLKGFSLGGAMVSKIHANFFVNANGSTSQDMLDLIHLVKGQVYSKFGVQLEEEISYIHPHKV